MQNETSLYKMPPEKMVFTHEQLGAGRELGEAEIVNTIWGKAKVRIIRKESRSGWVWLLVVLCVLAAITVGWYVAAKQNAGVSAPAQVAAPPDSTPTHEPAETALPSSSDKPSVTTLVPAPADAAANTATPNHVAASPANVEKPEGGTDKPRPVVSSQTNTVQPEAHAPTRPANAKPGRKQAAASDSHAPPLNTPAADIPAKQPEGTATPANQPAKENSTPARTDAEAPADPPANAEAPKNDQPGSHP